MRPFLPHGAADPFTVAVADDVLNDLQDRLARARLPRGFPGEGWEYGTDVEYLRTLVDHWRTGYDWRAQERAINAVPQFKALVDDVPVHFIHVPGKGPRPMPLLLSHGWPWTFWDYRHLVGPLSDPASHGGDPEDAFDVVVPSLPGFTFSSPVPRAGVDWQVTADIFASLMHGVLGYERFGVFGGDWGRFIVLQVAHRYAEHVTGVHVLGSHPLSIWNTDQPWYLLGAIPPHVQGAEREQALARQRRFASHVTVQVLDPMTLAAAFHDSPVGLCSWLIERRRNWSDCDGDVENRFSKDDLLTTTMLYWVTECYADTARYYHDAAARRWSPDHDRKPIVEVPTGVSLFLADDRNPRADEQMREEWNLTFRNEHERGGHFAPAEEPAACIADIRDFFRSLRSTL